MEKNLGLYVHIPFCLSKCGYCDFYSITDKNLYQRYTDALILHMEDYAATMKDIVMDTVFIGGGTPTVLPKNSILDIIGGIYTNFNVSEDAEFTIEANPATASAGMLKKYREEGVNRLSIGMQSSCDNELCALGRIHTQKDFENFFGSARKAGFGNINTDIMYGIPEQTMSSFRRTLNLICGLHPEHISLYGLKIEDGTPFAGKHDSLILPDEDQEYEMYEYAVGFLRENGYQQYEISNFALPGYECRHNLKYWNCQEYLGLGPGAHSYFHDSRFSFKRDIELYMKAMEFVDEECNILDENYEISPYERIGEYIMLRLRLCEGIHTRTFYNLFNLDFERIYGEFLEVYIENDFMEKRGESYCLTTKGMYVSNYILSAMLDFEGSESTIISNIINGQDKV